MPNTTNTSTSTPQWAWALLGLFVLIYTTQAWRSVGEVNILIDEVTDTHIASMLRSDPLFGSGNDGSQARLPMYATAFMHTIATRLHPAGENLPILTTARATSIAVGATGVFLLFLVARRWFDTPTALLASGILAIAPYFLNLSRTAMTEGDAYCPTAVLMALFTFGLYQTKRTTPRLVMFSVAAGLMTATKFYLVALLPAFFVCDVLTPSQQRRADDQPTAIKPIVILWAMCAALLMALAAGLTQLRPIPDAIEDRSALTPAAVMWLVAFALLVGGVFFFTLRKPPLPDGGQFPTWSTIPAWFAIVPLAAAATFAFPEHALHQNIMGTFLGRVFGWDESTPGSGYGEAARLYGSLVLLKLGIPLGIMTFVAGPWLLWQAVRHPGARLVAATLGMYGFVLLALPVRQHFYLMAAYPVMILMLAAFITALARALPAKPLRYGWSAIAAASVAYLAWGHIQVFPTFGYYGYEVTGDHWLGSEPRGYRDIVQVTSDGTFDAMDWLAQHAEPTHKVYSYLSLRDRWTINRYDEERDIPFSLIHHDPERARDPEQVPHADYLLIAMQNRVSYHDAPSEEAIATKYNPEPIHAIYRGRGKYRLPVAQIYQSKHIHHTTRPTPPNDGHIVNALPSD